MTYKILHLEDDDDITKRCQRAMKKTGFTYDTTDDATDALRRVKEYDLLIIDLDLSRTGSGQYGGDLTKDLREQNVQMMVYSGSKGKFHESFVAIPAFRWCPKGDTPRLLAMVRKELLQVLTQRSSPTSAATLYDNLKSIYGEIYAYLPDKETTLGNSIDNLNYKDFAQEIEKEPAIVEDIFWFMLWLKNEPILFGIPDKLLKNVRTSVLFFLHQYCQKS